MKEQIWNQLRKSVNLYKRDKLLSPPDCFSNGIIFYDDSINGNNGISGFVRVNGVWVHLHFMLNEDGTETKYVDGVLV